MIVSTLCLIAKKLIEQGRVEIQATCISGHC